MAGRLSDSDELTESHEINVTPFIDVMLVLLIIFMVAAPLSTVDVPVDLPASNAPPATRPEKPLFISVTADRALHLGEEAVPADRVGAALDAATGGDRQTRIFVRADRVVPYGDLMEAMNALRAAGYVKIALVGLEGAPGQPGAGQPGAGPSGAGPSGAGKPQP